MNTDVFSIRMSKDDKAFLADMAEKTNDSMAGVMASIFYHGKKAFYTSYLYKVALRKHLMEFFHLTDDDVKGKDIGLDDYRNLFDKMSNNDNKQLLSFYNKVNSEWERLKKEWEEEESKKELEATKANS